MYPPYFGQYSGQGYPSMYGAMLPYGSLNLTANSPPQSWDEPLTLAEVQQHLNFFDKSKDEELLAFISGARVQAEILQNRDLVVKQWDLSLDYWNGFRIALRDPLRSVDLIRFRDADGNYTTMVQDQDYVVDPGKHPPIISPTWTKMIWPSFTPWPTSAILIRFTSGIALDDPFWNDAGALLKVGMKELITHWFENRIPFEVGASAIQEYPYAVTMSLSSGAVTRAK